MTTSEQPTITDIAKNLNAIGVPPIFESDDARVLFVSLSTRFVE